MATDKANEEEECFVIAVCSATIKDCECNAVLMAQLMLEPTVQCMSETSSYRDKFGTSFYTKTTSSYRDKFETAVHPDNKAS
jgi:hypothetical protein